MIKEIYTRNEAIAEFINNNTGLVSFMNIIKSLYKHDGVLGDYVWYNADEFNDAVKDWKALDIIKYTPVEFFPTADYFHIGNNTFSCASVLELCTYFDHDYVRIQVIKYLVRCTHGHTGDDILDGIVNATTDTLFDDSFYIYHAAEERPEDYDDGNY